MCSASSVAQIPPLSEAIRCCGSIACRVGEFGLSGLSAMDRGPDITLWQKSWRAFRQPALRGCLSRCEPTPSVGASAFLSLNGQQSPLQSRSGFSFSQSDPSLNDEQISYLPYQVPRLPSLSANTTRSKLTELRSFRERTARAYAAGACNFANASLSLTAWSFAASCGISFFSWHGQRLLYQV
jgi:hypothetical protein